MLNTDICPPVSGDVKARIDAATDPTDWRKAIHDYDHNMPPEGITDTTGGWLYRLLKAHLPDAYL